MRRQNTTNEFLKECMADALIRLLKEKPMDAITISEMTRLANVGRVTYYRNFTSKEDVLTFKINLLLETWWESMDFADENDSQQIIVTFMELIFSMQNFLNILLQNDLAHLLLNCFYDLLGPKTSDSPTMVFKKAYHTYGIFGVISEWMKNGMKETPQEVAVIFATKIFDPEKNSPTSAKDI